MMKRVGGGIMLFLGVVLLGWIGYNLFIEMQPQAQGRSPIGPSLFALTLTGVGFQWVRGKSVYPQLDQEAKQ